VPNKTTCKNGCFSIVYLAGLYSYALVLSGHHADAEDREVRSGNRRANMQRRSAPGQTGVEELIGQPDRDRISRNMDLWRFV
jgi:hypothetical protein